MKSKFATTMWVLWYALLAGATLTMFSIIPSMLKYIFSLLTLYIGFRFFRRFESIGLRIAFILVGIVFYFLFVLITTMIQYLKEHPELFSGAV